MENSKLKINGSIITEPEVIANKFNQYYLNIPKDLTHNIETDLNNINAIVDKIEKVDHQINLEPATPQEIINIVRKLKNSEAVGVDGIKVRVIKKTILAFVGVFTYLINIMLTEGVFPKALKEAILIPTYKNKGDVTEISNFRPLSLLTIFSKFFENVIKSRIISFLDAHSLLVNNQFGFRKGKSTTNAIHDSLHFLLKSLDENKVTLGLFCDLQKAFDCLDHTILLRKLDKLGIRGIAGSLIASYLKERYQKVEIKNFKEGIGCKTVYSERGLIECGVPQGSVLGPLLFIIYMNDLNNSVTNAKVTMFADDTTLLVSGKQERDVCQTMNVSLEQASDWFKSNKLVLNNGKTKLIKFSNGKRRENDIVPPPEILNGQDVINETNSTTFLGMIVDSRLNWHGHVEALSAKLNKACFALRILRGQLGLPHMKIVYFGYFESLIRYGIIFWGGSKLKNNIFKIQKNAVRILLKKNRRHSCRSLFKLLDVMTVSGMYIFELIMYVKNNLDAIEANISCAHGHNTRQSHFLRKDKHKTALFERDVVYRGSLYYNLLPPCIKNISNATHFRTVLKKFIIKKCIYSENEFTDACKCS